MGAETARILSEGGARVFAAQRSPSDYEDILVDFAEPNAPAKVIDVITRETDRLDILVNNAGVMREGTVEETSLDDWQLQLQVNLTTPFLLIRHAMPLLRIARGAIVNVGSIEGLGNNPRHPAYGASKAAMIRLSKSLAIQFGSFNIRSNCILPGAVETPMQSRWKKIPNAKKNLKEFMPIKKVIQPRGIAEAIIFLLSDQSKFITGTELIIDGGLTARP